MKLQCRAWMAGAAVAAGLVGPWVGPARASASSPSADCNRASVAADITRELLALYQTQQSDGSLQFRGTQRLYASSPILATLSLFATETLGDPQFASQSAASISRHYQSLFSSWDSDGNLRIETSVKSGTGSSQLVEDVRFNSLLALDLQSLARLYIELRKPMRALFWYEGARTLERSIVAGCYEVESGFFYPYAVRSRSLVRLQNDLSALPVLFPGVVGDNHRKAIVTNYVLDSARNLDRSIMAERTSAGDPSSDGSRGLLRAALLVDVINAAGMRDEAGRARARAQEAILTQPVPVTAYQRFLRCHLNSSTRPLHDPYTALVILRDIVRARRVLPDNEIVRAGKDSDRILAFLHNPGPSSEEDLERVGTAVRNTYQIISSVRKSVEAGSFFTSQDVYELSGINANQTMDHLFEDVQHVLHQADNEVFRRRYEGTGFSVTATVLDERAVMGRGVRTKWTFNALTRPVSIKSARVTVDEKSSVLVDPSAGLTVKPGSPVALPLEIIAPPGDVNTLKLITATLLMTDSNGKHSRCHFFRTVFLEHPITVTATFPKVRTLEGPELPLDILVTRRTRDRVTVRANWFSSGGLQLREGANTEFRFPEQGESVLVRYHVRVPPHCRPGSFDFQFKFYGDQREVGVIENELFRHFEWVFAGPFAPTPAPLETVYAPERSIDIYRSYNGQNGTIAWHPLVSVAYLGGGDISLRPLIKRPAVSFLYTVVQSSYAHETPVVLMSNVPTSLYVNGRKVIENAAQAWPMPAWDRVQFSEGLNDILIKVHGDGNARLHFDLGDDANLAPDEFVNDLVELIDGFDDFKNRNPETITSADEYQQVVAFRYIDGNAKSVSVMGSFNGWSPNQSPMHKVGSDTWEITLSLTPGRHAYRFLVNNRKQILDPSRDMTEPDGYGGRNSVIVVESE